MAAIPHRRSAASRPTVHLVLQPSRVKLWPFSGGQVVNTFLKYCCYKLGNLKIIWHLLHYSWMDSAKYGYCLKTWCGEKWITDLESTGPYFLDHTTCSKRHIKVKFVEQCNMSNKVHIREKWGAVKKVRTYLEINIRATI